MPEKTKVVDVKKACTPPKSSVSADDKSLEVFATSTDPQDLEQIIELGENSLRRGDFALATKCYSRAADLNPSPKFRALYWEWLGTMYEVREEGGEALKAYTQWAECEPDSIVPIERMGALMISEGLWTDLMLLRSQYKRRAENTSDPAILESLALYTHIMEQISSEEDPSPAELAQAALEVKYNSIPMRYLLGLLFLKAGHLEGANAEFSRVIELDEDATWVETRFNLDWSAASARLMLGRIARIQRRYIEALNILGDCVNDEQLDDLEPLEEYASLLIELGLYGTALSCLATPEGTTAVAPWLQRLRARCLLGLGRIEEARQLFLEEPDEEDDETEVEVVESLSEAVESTGAGLDSTGEGLGSAGEGLDSTGEDADDGSSNQDETPEQQAEKQEILQQRLAEADAKMRDDEPQVAMELFTAIAQDFPDSQEAVAGQARAAAALGDTAKAVLLFEAQLAAHPDNLNLWKQLSALYKESGDIEKYRLTRIQIQTMLPDVLDQPRNEWIAPAVPDSGSTGLGISARSLPGTGKLIITGAADNESTVNIVWTFLRAEAAKLGITEKLSELDLHVHVRDLGNEPRVLTPVASGPLGFAGAGAETAIGNEDIALAVLMAMVGAITGKTPSGTTVVGGRLDLLGWVHNSPTLVPALSRLSDSGIKWTRLILPRTITVDIDRLPADIWVNTDVALCIDASDAIKLLDE